MWIFEADFFSFFLCTVFSAIKLWKVSNQKKLLRTLDFFLSYYKMSLIWTTFCSWHGQCWELTKTMQPQTVTVQWKWRQWVEVMLLKEAPVFEVHKLFCIISCCSAKASLCPKIILIIENIEKGHCYIPTSPLGFSSTYLTLSRLPQIQASFESASDLVTSVAHAWSQEGPYGAHGEIHTILSLILCECRTSCPLLLLLFSPVLSVSRGCQIPTNLPNTPLTMCCENRLVRTFAISLSPPQAI